MDKRLRDGCVYMSLMLRVKRGKALMRVNERMWGVTVSCPDEVVIPRAKARQISSWMDMVGKGLKPKSITVYLENA